MGLMLIGVCVADESPPILRIATDATFAPFHMLDEAGRPTGFDIELARAVAKNAGFEPDVIVLPYEQLFSGLVASTHDVVAATTGITPEREQLYWFSEPYFETCQVAVVRAGPTEPRSLDDLRGARIGAGGSGTSSKAMKTIDASYVHLDDGQGVPSLESGIIDAWLVDEFDGVAAARASRGRLLVLPEAVAPEHYAFVIATGRKELKALLDRSLALLEHNGYVEELQIEFGVERGSGWPVVR
jgi:cystine transport system substrate-binding protein